MISALILVIIAIFLPPVAVFIISGCGADLLINICLTILGFLPGHVHAFYLIYVYYHKQEQAAMGIYDSRPAPGVYSDNVNTGGEGYGSMVAVYPGELCQQERSRGAEYSVIATSFDKMRSIELLSDREQTPSLEQEVVFIRAQYCNV
ncbi:hypothetical protein D0862_06197 [Hortaea werneckii]|uniref:Stress response RCI peptide n=1 Tax=Hortaea werneckii TaxID=91943 RepID=A0A3M7GLJ5_HORWE|nr:hypothetical protein D0862_06197 [Hortaea werneckii]